MFARIVGWLALGAAATPLSAQEKILELASSAPKFGRAIVRIGDLDGDGKRDLAIGAEKSVHAVSSASGAILWTHTDTNYLGDRLVDLGDLDGDGVDDILCGGSGFARELSGRDGTELRSFAGSLSTFGNALAALGDLDGDGVADFAVGSAGVLVVDLGDVVKVYNLGVGRVDVYSGATSQTIRSFTSTVANDCFGGTVVDVGDVDHDGFDDLYVSTRIDPFSSGHAYWDVYSGASGALLLHRDLPPAVFSIDGSAAAIGDLDGDGHADFVVGEGAEFGVRAVSGASGSTLWTRTKLASQDRFAWSIARVRDLDGDGFDDVLAGAPQPSIGGLGGHQDFGPGYVELVSGRTGDLLHTFVGESVGSNFGASSADVGDLDGDGQDEIAIGIPLGSWYHSRMDVALYSGAAAYSRPMNYCDAPYAGGTSYYGARTHWFGSQSVAQNDLKLALLGATTHRAAWLYASRGAASITLDPIHDEFLCLALPLIHAAKVARTDGNGELVQTLDLGASSPFAPGETWYFQYRYAKQSGSAYAFSNALAMTFTP